MFEPLDPEEEALLREQQEFLSSQSQPAAKVVRRHGATTNPLLPSQTGETRPPSHTGQRVPTTAGGDILHHEVKEKVVGYKPPVFPARSFDREVDKYKVSHPPRGPSSAPNIGGGNKPKGKSLFAQRFDSLNKPPSSSSKFYDPSQPQKDDTKQFLSNNEKLPTDQINSKLAVPELANMSEEEIKEAQEEIKRFFSPESVAFLKERALKKTQLTPPPASSSQSPQDHVNLKTSELREVQLPFELNPNWVNMEKDKIETEKLQWIGDLPTAEEALEQDGRPMRGNQVRFDFEGNVIAPELEIPTHVGLHHHGDQPALAGYTLGELASWIRSRVPSQRIIALTTLSKITSRAWAGSYNDAKLGNVTYDGDTIMECLFGLGYPFLLRLALDDKSVSVLIAALSALRSLVVIPEDELLSDRLAFHPHGLELPPLCPPMELTPRGRTDKRPDGDGTRSSHDLDGSSLNLEEHEEEEEEEEGFAEPPLLTGSQHASPGDAISVADTKENKECQKDLLKGLLKMNILPRLRYLLEVCLLVPAYHDILDVLIRIARYSKSSIDGIMRCPRLLVTVQRMFILPRSAKEANIKGEFTLTEKEYETLRLKAIKLIRVLCSAGKMTSFTATKDIFNPLMVYLYNDLHEGHLFDCQSEEEASLRTEILILWNACLSYGLHLDFFAESSDLLIRSSLKLLGLPLESSHSGLNPSIGNLVSAYLLLLITALKAINLERVHAIENISVSKGSLLKSIESDVQGPFNHREWGIIIAVQPAILTFTKAVSLHLSAYELSSSSSSPTCSSGEESTSNSLAAGLEFLATHELVMRDARMKGYSPVDHLDKIEKESPPILIACFGNLPHLKISTSLGTPAPNASLFSRAISHLLGLKEKISAQGIFVTQGTYRFRRMYSLLEANTPNVLTFIQRAVHSNLLLALLRYLSALLQLHRGFSSLANDLFDLSMLLSFLEDLLDPLVPLRPVLPSARTSSLTLFLSRTDTTLLYELFSLYYNYFEVDLQDGLPEHENSVSQSNTGSNNPPSLASNHDLACGLFLKLSLLYSHLLLPGDESLFPIFTLFPLHDRALESLSNYLVKDHAHPVKGKLAPPSLKPILPLLFPPQPSSSTTSSKSSHEGLNPLSRIVGINFSKLKVVYKQFVLDDGPLSLERVKASMHRHNRTLIDDQHSIVLPCRTANSGKTQSLPLSDSWIFGVLASYYQRFVSAETSGSTLRTFHVDLDALGGTLQYYMLLESLQVLSFLSFSSKLMNIMKVFVLGLDVYGDAKIQRLLSGMFGLFAESTETHETNHDSLMTNSLTILKKAIDEFVSMSFANQMVASYILLYMQMRAPEDFRSEIIGNDRFLALCEVDVADMRGNMSPYLFPLETNQPLLHQYLVALLARKVANSTFLYWIMLHHMWHFVFEGIVSMDDPLVQESVEGQRRHAFSRILLALDDESYHDFMYYDSSRSKNSKTGFQKREELASVQIEFAWMMVEKEPPLKDVIKSRHPSLWHQLPERPCQAK